MIQKLWHEKNIFLKLCPLGLKLKELGWRCSSVVEHLASMCEVLDLINRAENANITSHTHTHTPKQKKTEELI